MPYIVELPDGTEIEFPDNVPKEQARKIILADKRFEKYIPKATLGSVAEDTVSNITRGGAGLLDAGAGLARFLPDAIGGGAADALSGQAQRAREAADQFQSERSQLLREGKSKRVQNAEETEGQWGAAKQTFAEYVNRPGLLVDLLVEQLPQLGAMGAAGAAQKGVAAAQAVNRMLAVGAGMQGASVTSETFDEAYKAALKKGLSEAAARDVALAASRLAGLEAGALSYAVNKAIPGASLLEGRLAGVPGASRFKTAIGEGLGEIAEEAGGRFASNVSIRDLVDENKDITAGLGQTAVESGIAGAGLGTLIGRRDREEKKPTSELTPIEQALQAQKLKATSSETAPADVTPPTLRPNLEDLNASSVQAKEQALAYIEDLKEQLKGTKGVARKRVEAELKQAETVYGQMIIDEAADRKRQRDSAFADVEAPTQGALFDQDVILPEPTAPVEEAAPAPEVDPNQMGFDFNQYNEQGQAALIPELPEGGTDYSSVQREARAESDPQAVLSIGKVISLLNEAGVRGGKPIMALKNMQKEIGQYSPGQYIALDGYRDLPKLKQVIDILTPVAENSTAKNAGIVRDYLTGLQQVYDTNTLQRSLMDEGAMALPDTLPLPFAEGRQNGNPNGQAVSAEDTRGMEPRKSVRGKLAKSAPNTGIDGQGLVNDNVEAVRPGQQLQQPSAPAVIGANPASVGVAVDPNDDTAAAAQSELPGMGVSSGTVGTEPGSSEGVQAELTPKGRLVKGKKTSAAPLANIDPTTQREIDNAIPAWEKARSAYLKAKDKESLAIQGRLYENMVTALKPLYEAANNYDDSFTTEEQEYAQERLADIPPKQVEELARRYNPSTANPRKIRSSGLSSRVEFLIKGNRPAKEILQYIANNSTSLTNKRVSNALLRLPMTPPTVRFSPDPFGKGWLASFNEDTNTISIHQIGDSEYAMLHEMMHAATVYAMNARAKSTDVIYKLFDDYKKVGDNELYGFTNEKEFVAEAFSNPEFQAELKRLDAGAGRTFWQKLEDFVRKLLGLGMIDRSAFTKLMEALPQIGADNDEYFGTRAPERAGDGDGFNPAIVNSQTTSLADRADMVAAPKEANRVWDKIRTFNENYNDKLYQFDAQNREAFSGRTEIGDWMNPSLLMAQAQDAARIVEQGSLRGYVTTLPSGIAVADNLSLGTPSPDASPATQAAHAKLMALGVPQGSTVSVKEIYNYVVEQAEAAGATYERTVKDITTVLNLIRIGEIRTRDNDLEQQAVNFDAMGKPKEAKKLRDMKVEYANLRSPGIPDKASLDQEIDNAQRIFQATPELQIVQGMMDVVRMEQIDQMVKVGRLTRDKADAWQEATAYVPFERLKVNPDNGNTPIDDIVIDRAGGRSGVTSLHSFKSLIGSDAQVNNVLDSFAKTVGWMQADTIKNNATNRSLKTMELLGRAKKAMTGSSQSVERPDILRTFENGVPTYYEISDRREAIAFQAIDNNVFEELGIAHKFAQTLRIGITALPPFTFKQIAEDIHRAFVYSGVENPLQLLPKILVNFPKIVLANIANKQTPIMRELSAMGVIGGVDYTRHNPLLTVKEMAGVPDNAGMVRKATKKLLRVAESLSVASDMAVRAAIYEQTLNEGGNIELAQHRAREIINFSRRGASKATTFMTTTIPFFNAYVRGLDKLAKAAAGTGPVNNMTVREARTEFAKRMMVLVAIGTMYAMSVVGDDEYEQLDDQVRDYNWIIPGASKDFTLAIPLPRDLGLLFKTIPERAVRYMYHDGNEDAGQLVREMLKQGMDVVTGGSFTPSILRPFIEDYTNYSLFMGRNLESQQQQQMEPWMRYNMSTSDSMKALGEATSILPTWAQVSPIKAENYVRGIFGTTGALALTMMDAIANPTRPDRPLHKMMVPQLTGSSAFMKDIVGSRWQNQFYEIYEKTTQAANTYKKLEETDPGAAAAFAQDNLGYLMVEDYVRSIHKDLTSFKDMLEMVNRDQSMSPEDKRAAIVEINKLRADLASRVVSVRTAVNQY